MSQFKRAATIYCVFERNERTVNSIRERRTDHVDLRCLRSQILFLLRTLSLADDMTKRARMCAVKRLSNRLAQRRVPGVIDDHCRPRERLQSDPMQTNRETKRADRGDPAGAAQHDAMLTTALFDVNQCCNADSQPSRTSKGTMAREATESIHHQ
jgi:hypothetical protein